MNRALVQAALFGAARISVTAGQRPAARVVQTGRPGPPGPPGPSNPYAYSPMLADRWWYTNPSTANTNVACVLGHLMFQPLWTGDNLRLTGLHIDLPTLQDTAGNVLRMALYADSAALWPRDLIADLGQLDTTTAAANISRVLNVDQAVNPQSVYWICAVSQNGVGATFKCSHTAHPLVGMFDTQQVRDVAPSNQYSGFYIPGYPSGPFPALIDSAQLLPIQAIPRLMARFKATAISAEPLPAPRTPQP